MRIEQATIRTDGRQWKILRCGDAGPLALCLHGFPDTPHTFRHLLPGLADAGFRAVAPWTRGYAPTPVAEDGDYSIAALAADANTLHDALDGDGEAILIGHDWGAMTAYAASAAGPERWRRVIAMAVPPPGVATTAFGDFDQLRRSFYVFLFQTPLAEFVVGAEGLQFLDRLWSAWSPTYDGAGDLPAVKDALRSPANLAAAIGYYRAMFSAGVPSGGPAVPTLYLHGSDDGAFGADLIGGSLAELPTGSRVEVIDRVGHFLHLERPEDVNRMVLEWIRPTPG
jgi:pimeloyl-ACP methyl ester carboxylesterase